MNDLLKTIAAKIKERRRVLGITQEQLAEQCGLSVNFIARLEIASKTPSLETLQKLSDNLHLPVSEIVSPAVSNINEADFQEVKRIFSLLDDVDSEFLLSLMKTTANHLYSQKIK